MVQVSTMDTTMSGPLSKKPRSLSSLLIEAWKNRWSEVEWGVHVKQVLPRGVSGDVYDLADCILQQSLIGVTPNRLMISYLYYSINAGIVSHGAVLEAIASQDDFTKTECVSCLLDFVLSIREQISSDGSDGDCIELTKSLISISIWLLRCLYSCANILIELRNAPSQLQASSSVNLIASKQGVSNTEKCCKMLSFISQSPFIVSLINVGRNEDKAKYKVLQQVFNQLLELEQKSNILASVINNVDYIEAALSFLTNIDWSGGNAAQIASTQLQTSLYGKNSTFHPSSLAFSQINPIIAFNVVLHPASETGEIARQLSKIAKFNDLSLSDLYCECIRACLIGLVDATGEKPSASPSSDDLKWTGFTFHKMPQILFKLEAINGCHPDHPEVEKGLNRLLTYSPLLDLTDRKSNVEWFPLFLKELQKASLISEAKVEQLSSKRLAEASKSSQLVKRDLTKTTQAASSLLLKLEPTIHSILQTLESDFSKNSDAILDVLCHMQSGRSLGLILSSLAASGKLRHFTMKLLKFNEFNKQPIGETTPKLAQTRGLLFDVTFLMLCQISQDYGSDVITQNPETQDTFFASWCSQCLPQNGSHRCPDAILVTCDAGKVEQLLNQITSSENDFRSNTVKWHEVCLNLPAAIKEVLLAWEHGAITTDTVKSILDNVKSKMCCLPIVVSAWLCSYITLLHHEERLKPVNILQQFILPFVREGHTEKDFYKERSSIMVNIIKRMMYDMLPTRSIQHGLIVKTPLAEIIESTFANVHSRSWLDLKSTYDISTLLNVGGSVWFVDSLVRQLLRWDHAHDLNRAVALIFGFFHLNLKECSQALVSTVLPSYLLSKSKQELLFQPRASALARLAVLTICATLTEQQMLGENYSNQRRKTSSTSSPSKQANGQGDILQAPNLPNGDSISHNKSKGQSELSCLLSETPFYLNNKDESTLLKDSYMRSVADLMLLLSSVTSEPEISQRTIFPLVFIEQLLLCVQDKSKSLLQFLTLETINNLIRICPAHLTYQFIIVLGDVGTAKSRKILAKSLCQLHRVKKLSGI